MRITKVKVNVKDEGSSKKENKMVLMHRKAEKGTLILDNLSTSTDHPEDQTDRIIARLKNESFQLSLEKKIIEERLTKTLHKSILNIIRPIIQAALDQRSFTVGRLFLNDNDKKTLTKALKQKFHQPITYRVKDETSKSGYNLKTLNLPETLITYAEHHNLKDLNPIYDWLTFHIKQKKANIQKSISNNRIVVDYSDDNLENLSPRKQALAVWEKEYEATSKLDLKAFHQQFKIEEFVQSLPLPGDYLYEDKKQKDKHHKDKNDNGQTPKGQRTEDKNSREEVDSNKTVNPDNTVDLVDKSFNFKVKDALKKHQSSLFGREAKDEATREANKKDVLLVTYQLEVVKYFEHYFPIKRSKKLITPKEAQYYLKVETIRQRITDQLENAIRSQMLQKEKLSRHSKESEISSATLSKIKRNEFFVLNLVEMCTFASNNLRNIIDIEQEEDILGQRDLKNSLNEGLKNFNKELFYDFFQLPYDDDEKTIWALRGSVQAIRNNITHYESNASETIFQIKEFEYWNRIKEKSENLCYSTTPFKQALSNELKAVDSLFIEQFRSNDLLHYYQSADLNTLFDRITLNLCRSAVPFAPGFKSIFNAGLGLQEGNPTFNVTHYLMTEGKKKQTTQSPAYPAFRFLLKLIYTHTFTKWFVENDKAFREAVHQVLKDSKERAEKENKGKNGKQKYAYNGIEEMKPDQTVKTYMGYLHAKVINEQSVKGKEDDNTHFYTQQFINYVFAKGFDTYLDALPIDFIKRPNQDERDKKVTNQEYESTLKIKVDCGGITPENPEHIAFYTFCKLLDNNHLSDLRNEWIKYRESNPTQESTQESTSFDYQPIIAIIELCLLSGDRISQESLIEESLNVDLKDFIISGDQGEKLFKQFYTQNGEDSAIIFAPIEITRKYCTLELLKNIVGESGKVTGEEYKKYQKYLKKDAENSLTKIAKLIERRDQLHCEWLKISNDEARKAFIEREGKEYQDKCESIDRYNWLNNKLHMVHVKRLHNLMIQLLSRMSRFVSIWDRDFKDVSHNIYNYKNKDGVPCKLKKSVLYKETRNFIAHNNYITKSAEKSIIELIEGLRELMAYDRKLKNAITKSIINVFDQNGMVLRLHINEEDHKIEIVSVTPKEIQHFKKTISTKQVPKEFCELSKQLLTYKNKA